MTDVSIAGSTGSIGTQTLQVIEAEPERFRVVGLAAGSNLDLLAAQAALHRPQIVALGASADLERARALMPAGTEVLAGDEGLRAVAEIGDVVVNAVVGFAGLPVTLAALSSGRRLALANKESLIAAGPVVQGVRGTAGSEIVPVDSEHCALHQCLRAGRGADEVERLILTASGGPFRGRSVAELESVTTEDALAHPTWTMGAKVTIDSSTLMNKGLEVIEAHELFGVGYDRIEVVVHPQSVVHSMVEFRDGATIAQLSAPDMRLPIGYALTWPERLTTPFGRLDWTSTPRLDFEAPDPNVFTCLGLAYDAGQAGGTAPAWLSAANEVAVDAFLTGRLGWLSIAAVISATMEAFDGAPADSLAAVLDADRRSRQQAAREVERRTQAA